MKGLKIFFILQLSILMLGCGDRNKSNQAPGLQELGSYPHEGVTNGFPTEGEDEDEAEVAPTADLRVLEGELRDQLPKVFEYAMAETSTWKRVDFQPECIKPLASWPVEELQKIVSRGLIFKKRSYSSTIPYFVYWGLPGGESLRIDTATKAVSIPALEKLKKNKKVKVTVLEWAKLPVDLELGLCQE